MNDLISMHVCQAWLAIRNEISTARQRVIKKRRGLRKKILMKQLTWTRSNQSTTASSCYWEMRHSFSENNMHRSKQSL